MRRVDWIWLFFLIVGILSSIIAAIDTWQVGLDSDRTIYRCQVAGDLPRMAKCVDDVTEAMEEYGITEGYVFPLVRDPALDVGLDYVALRDISVRAQAVAESQDVVSASYQVALDDMRGTLREIHVASRDYMAWRMWYSWMQVLSYLLTLVFMVVTLATM